MKKLFLAITTQDGLEATAPQILKKLKAGADLREMDMRWVPLKNFHVTLIFLGRTHEERLPEIYELMKEVAAKTAPFTLKISDVGAFPDEFNSRVLWFGVQNSRALRGLHANLSEKFTAKSYPLEEREFSPHLTIGRLRNPHKTKDLVSPFVRKKIAKILVEEIVLYESVGTVPFPVYKPLEKVRLTAPPSEDEDTNESSSSEAD